MFYQVGYWIPDRLSHTCRYDPSMTTCFESDDGILTNNNAESYNYRMKKAQGDHPNLPKFIGALRTESSNLELQWMQRDRPKSAQMRRREDRE